MGAANDYHTPNLQLAKECSWLITSYNVQQLVLQALRYIMLHWEVILSANVSTSSAQPTETALPGPFLFYPAI